MKIVEVNNHKDLNISVAPHDDQIIVDFVSAANSTAEKRTASLTVGEGAHVQYVLFVDDTVSDFNEHRKVSVGAGAFVQTHYCMTPKHSCAFTLETTVHENARIEQQMLAASFNSARYTINDTTSFTGKDAYGRCINRLLAADTSHVSVDSKLVVRPLAQRTDAHLAITGNVLNPEAQCYLVPGLDIRADDVRCGHTASVSHLDPEQLFYLYSRGISAQQAAVLILNGIVNDFVAGIEHAPTRHAILKLGEKIAHE